MLLSRNSKVPPRQHVPFSSQGTPSSSLLAAIEHYPKTLGYCVALAFGILLYGFVLVIVGNVSAMSEFHLWDVASPLGGLFDAIAAGQLQDRAGRRCCLAFAAILSAAAVAVAYVSNMPNDIDARRALFLFAKLVQGSRSQTYMSEILPPVLRGPMLAFFPIFMLLGQLMGSLVVYKSLDIAGSMGSNNCFVSQWPFSALPLLVASLKRFERLRSFIEKEDRDGASKAIGYRDCFRGVDRRRTMIVMFANLIPSIFGLPLLSKTKYFLQLIGMKHHRSFLFLQTGIVLRLAANLISMQTLLEFGRVPLIIVSLSVSTLAWMGMGIADCFPGIFQRQWSFRYTGNTLVTVITACGIGAWPASYAVGGESSSLRLRAKSQGLGWFVSGLSSVVFNLILPYIFSPDQGALRDKTGFVCAGFSAIALVEVWLYKPEMKDRTPSKIDDMFEAVIPARQFRKWSPLIADPLSSDRSPQA
ncbi:MFS general substrate transporter [Aspergillus vadensis CBS 113365]|uniref:MFS general substrate transporter n=1 Tax=Aspergillus vadensis (strain CBS 113365 / IMI 142717 / IBT 24658) TaxID=1448311 RepID=A0A319C9E6_ASPVC|nr:MFS general substrate transporter [Aspergillus vadensis CBS 113365]PYH75093.1 MFS general substrate transporter [Aspergillus vadensis CBS 113365]